TGLAIPHFEKTIETGQADTVKYKKELIRANEFIGNFHVLYERYDEAMRFYNRVLALDPDYAAVRESVRSIQEFKKKSK
ncbi:MAG TPA: tetratricopeptide repeat protein, partial [Chitinophagales bacterium]|nr:tetratricopeptide repeat protein [Chitinophagales bacterium]